MIQILITNKLTPVFYVYSWLETALFVAINMQQRSGDGLMNIQIILHICDLRNTYLEHTS